MTAAGVTQHFYCAGSGGPTVVLLGGVDTGAADIWGDVLPELSQSTRVCAVDRAGVGASPERPATTNGPVRNADELLAGLKSAGEKGPYIFTGWSYGGVVALTAAAQAQQSPEPAQGVAGVVLVDGSLPDEYRTIDTSPWTEAGQNLAMAAAEPMIANLRLAGEPMVVLKAGDPLSSQRKEAYKAAGMENLSRLSENSVTATVGGADHDIADSDPQAVVAAVQATVTSVREHNANLGTCPADFRESGLTCQPLTT